MKISTRQKMSTIINITKLDKKIITELFNELQKETRGLETPEIIRVVFIKYLPAMKEYKLNNTTWIELFYLVSVLNK